MRPLYRLYLRYVRNIAKKTDLGRLAAPSVLALLDDALGLTGSQSALDITTSDRIWETLETILEVLLCVIDFVNLQLLLTLQEKNRAHNMTM